MTVVKRKVVSARADSGDPPPIGAIPLYNAYVQQKRKLANQSKRPPGAYFPNRRGQTAPTPGSVGNRRRRWV